jgi:O-antigen ligase
MLLVKFKFPLRKGLSSFIYLSLILGLFLAAIGSNSISKKLESLRNPLKAMSGRIEVLQDAPSIIADFPVFGTGLGTFHDIFPKYKTFKSLVYRFAHNEPLQLVIETGFLGFILVAVFLALYLNTIFIVWIKRHYPYAVCISLGCVVGLISVGLHSFFEFMLHVPAVTILFFVNLAVAFRSVHMGRKQGELPVPSWSFNLKK